MPCAQCFICREWSIGVDISHEGVRLCLPCYVDVLEIRQARGELGRGDPGSERLGEGPDHREPPSSWVHWVQTDLFSGGENRGPEGDEAS